LAPGIGITMIFSHGIFSLLVFTLGIGITMVFAFGILACLVFTLGIGITLVFSRGIGFEIDEDSVLYTCV